ncbi:MAG: hypothetical protein CSA29_06200 [Desulfobacterales bacterium]|nr:MAG: hypothetical protein CSA29_06200 [Desulfobacterales bacterium]
MKIPKLPQVVMDILKENETTAKKFNEIEIKILSILNFKDFFEGLLTEISDKFAVPYLWLTIIEESSIVQQLRTGNCPELLNRSTVFLPRQTFLDIINNSQQPLLANGNLDQFFPLIPKNQSFNIGSIAVAPITLDGEIVGSINQADTNPKRFDPSIDPSLLEQLALKVSLCLSNVTAHEQLKFMAFHDPLTGLLNRGVMKRVMDREYLRAKRYKNDLSVIFLDLDDFKTINDSAGHDVGDKALCLVADTLVQLKRDSDIVARFAGDEFIVILPSTGKEQAGNYIRRVRSALDQKPLIQGKQQFHIKFSYGIVNYADQDVTDAGTMLKKADQALYNAKGAKKSKHRPNLDRLS